MRGDGSARVYWASVTAGIAGLKEVPASRLTQANTAEFSVEGGWRRRFSRGLNADCLFGFEAGQRLVFPLKGARFGIHCLRHDYSGIIEISIDDVPLARVDIFGMWHKDTHQLLIVEGLPPRTKRVSIALIDKNSNSRGLEINIMSLFLPSHLSAAPSGALEKAEASADGPFINIFSRADNNVGDKMSSPARYFGFLENASLRDMFDWHPAKTAPLGERIQFYKDLDAGKVIIGGGGLLSTEWFVPALDFITRSLSKPAVLWGVGHNSPDPASWRPDFDQYEISAANFGLVGVRDHGTRFPWVPCASCLAPEFDRDVAAVREVGFVMHKHNVATTEYLSRNFPEIPVITNFGDFADMLKFIMECELVVTNSFHAAYWAVLAKRKVLAIPTSSKFFSFKHRVPITTLTEWRDHIRETLVHTDALEECRARNLEFANEVETYFAG